MAIPAGTRVRLTKCADKPELVGQEGYVIDEVAPGTLTDGRYTVNGIGWWRRTALCHEHELTPLKA